jgi:hypothetical protein
MGWASIAASLNVFMKDKPETVAGGESEIWPTRNKTRCNHGYTVSEFNFSEQ